MKKMKLILNESLISNKDSDIIEDTTVIQKPDYQIIDITVIPDETYYPTIQSILIDLDENNKLKESEDSKLDINILSETVNQKTGYSNSLFEFESSNHTITLSLVLQETDRRGIYKVEAYTTRGVKVFESNTYRPKYVIESYLNSLANEYLIDKPLKESSDYWNDKFGQDALDEYKNNQDEDGIPKGVKPFKVGDPVYYSYLSDRNEHNGLIGNIEWLRKYQYYPFGHRGDTDTVTYKWQGSIKYPDGSTEPISDVYAKGGGVTSPLKIAPNEFKPGDKIPWNYKLGEAEDPIKDDVKEDLAIEPGSDEEVMLDEIYEEPEKPYEGLVDDYKAEDPAPNSDPDDYSVEDFMNALKLTDEVYELNIDYSKWNDASQEERFNLVRPELSRFLAKHKNEFDKNPKLFDLIQYNLTDANFHTEAKVLRDLYRGGK